MCFETDCVQVDFIALSVLSKGVVCVGFVAVTDANDCWAYDVWESHECTNIFG